MTRLAVVALMLIVAISMTSLVSAQQGNQGILDGLRNLLRARRQPQPQQFFSQPPRFRQPPPRVPNRFQPSGNFRPQSNRFNANPTTFNRNPPPRFNSNSFGGGAQSFSAQSGGAPSFSAQQSFSPAQSSQQQSGVFRGNSNNNFRGQNSFRNQAGPRPVRPQSSFGQQSFSRPAAAPAAPVNGCPRSGANHDWNGRKYILTFLLEPKGCKTFTGELADEYCKQQGGRAVSLDSDAAAEHFLGVSAEHAQRYYWTGGRLDHSKGLLTWPSGRSEGWVRGTRFWSTTGGSESKGPQPDNRSQLEDGGSEETCLGVLNNFYADGIKWHDVACHHKKPTICEL